MKRIGSLYLCLLLVLLTGCHTQKTAVKQDNEQQTLQLRQHQLTAQLIAAAPDIRTMQVKRMQLTLEYGGQQMSGNASLNLVCDSAITVSVQPLLGIELYRIELTRSDMCLIDKLNRRYCRLTYEELARQTGIGVEFEDVQAILTQKPCVVGQTDSLYLPSLLAQEDENHYRMEVRQDRLDHRFVFDKGNLRLTSSEIEMYARGDKTRIGYADLRTTGGVLFPMQLQIDYQTGEFSATVSLNMQRIVFNEGAEVRAAALNIYSSVTLEQLLK